MNRGNPTINKEEERTIQGGGKKNREEILTFPVFEVWLIEFSPAEVEAWEMDVVPGTTGDVFVASRDCRLSSGADPWPLFEVSVEMTEGMVKLSVSSRDCSITFKSSGVRSSCMNLLERKRFLACQIFSFIFWLFSFSIPMIYHKISRTKSEDASLTRTPSLSN